MTREEVFASPSYHLVFLETAIYGLVESCMDKHNLTREQMCDKLKISKRSLSQILNGNANLNFKAVCEISLALGYYPTLDFTEIRKTLSVEKEEEGSLDEYINKTYKHRDPVTG